MELKNKRILFFSPAFFQYENMISEKMRELGAIVDMYDVRSVTKSFDRALLKISPSVFRKRSIEYYEGILEANKGKNYDYILIVKCDMTPISVLKKMRRIFPNAKLCLYLWDSIDNIPGIRDKFKYFDTIHSFDLEDCRNNLDLKFRPLFYGDQFCADNEMQSYKYDISFLGTIHSDRYRIIKQIQDIADKNGMKSFWFLYLQSKFIYYFYKITKSEFRKTVINDFCFEKMCADDIAKVVRDSRIILDIQHPKQTGLTMRTIEMVGMKKKIITTNPSIKTYDFYNEKNVAVIDRKMIRIDPDFIDLPYEPIQSSVYQKYSLESWVKDVLE